MYNNIYLIGNIKKGQPSKMSIGKTNFEINPLDINIAKIQQKLLSRLEREVPENGDFAPVFEEYKSKDPTLDLSTLKVICKYIKDNAPKKDTRALEIICTEKSNNNERARTLTQGTKKQILEYLNGSDYFNTCKKFAKN